MWIEKFLKPKRAISHANASQGYVTCSTISFWAYS